MAAFEFVNPLPHAMTPIGQFLITTIGPSKVVSQRVEDLKVAVAMKAVGAVKG